ncbi:hypothetical protein [Neisseria sicca]|uniref:hypothetical protein n=1 Tax=Neisseria sicca TaxID=490 RepID=UPI0011BD0189|nr:hypothetical protein [Neisseria sicca]
MWFDDEGEGLGLVLGDVVEDILEVGGVLFGKGEVRVFGLREEGDLRGWKKMVDAMKNGKQSVKIATVGK